MLTVVGMGPAGLQWLTPAAREAIAAAEALVGGSGLSSSFPTSPASASRWGPICRRCWRGLRPVPGAASWCCLWRPVVLWHIGTRLIAHFGRERVQVIPGISAVQYLCARAGIDMVTICGCTSSHGRAVSFDALAAHRKVAHGDRRPLRRREPREIAAQLMARGKGHRWMVIGENW